MEKLDAQEFADFLLERGVHEDAAAAFLSNRISGENFLSISEDDLKDLLPVIGDRITVRKILQEFKIEHESDKSTCNPIAITQDCEVDHPVPIPATEPCRPREDSRPFTTARTAVDSGQSDSEWHLTFKIPALHTFSAFVKAAVKSGVFDGKARHEIIQVLKTYISARTHYPSSEQYTTVCRKLVEKYPTLRDPVGNKAYASWKCSLRNAFKNFRRSNGQDNRKEPPSKRLRVYNEVEAVNMDDEEFEKAVDDIQLEWAKVTSKKPGGSRSEVKRLMDLTKGRRWEWIRTQHPLVMEVTQKFPCLEYYRCLRREFKQIVDKEDDVSTMMNSWPDWCDKLVKLSRLESNNRPYLRKILPNLTEVEPADDNAHDLICLELLLRLLFPRGLRNVIFIKTFESCDVDVDKEASEIQQSAPYIVVTGASENMQLYIYCEHNNLLESKSVRDALLDLVAVYFVFDIWYPKSLDAILIFIQHYVMDIKDSQPVPMTTAKVVGNLLKLD